MAVEGTLDAFALSDVLRLLAATGKTGWLFVDGDRGQGSVQLLDGQLVSASSEAAPEVAPVDEVMFELLRLRRGSFRFARDGGAGEVGADAADVHDTQEVQDLDEVLERAADLLDEWRDLEAVVPSSSHRVAMASELEGGEVTIDARLWPVLVAVAGSRTAGDLAASLGLGELPTARLISDLVELGVAVVEPPSHRSSRGLRAAHAADDLAGASAAGRIGRSTFG